MKLKQISWGFVLMFCFNLSGFGQKLDKVQTNYIVKKYEQAKIELDKVSGDPKTATNPDFWLWAATVYGSLFQDSALSVKYPEAREYSFYAFNKYKQLDPGYKLMTENAIPGKAVVESLYRGGWHLGYNIFYDNQHYDSAFKYLSKTVEILDLIAEKNWIGQRQALDTVSIFFTAYAAIYAKKKDDLAIPYIKRLADMKVATVPFVGEAKGIYPYLLQYYIDKKDLNSFNNYLSLFRKFYPAESLVWDDYETLYSDKNFSLADKTAAYDKADAAGTLTSNQYIFYGDMFYNLKEEEKKGMDSAKLLSYKFKAEDAFMKGFNKDKSNGLAAYNAGLINYIEWELLDDRYEENIKKIADLNRKKNAEKDPKKKAVFEPQVNAIKGENAKTEKLQHSYADKAIQWIESGFNALVTKGKKIDRNEKAIKGKSVDYLANLYSWKRDKSKDIASKYDAFDAAFKKYDALHGIGDFNSIKVGMKKNQVIDLIGEPSNSSKTPTATGVTEILSYQDYKKNVYINEKGEVSMISEYK